MQENPPNRRRRSPMRRFVVADRSMEPALVEGQGLIAWRGGPVKVGQLRVLEHPTRPGFWLVKRVETVTGGDGTDGGRMTVRSDNDAVDTVDSRRFGPVPQAGSYAVVVRVPRRWM
ncbi:hypothetical protein BH10ACT3_BH10ACT3_07430 [soil metagenome]